MREGERLAPPVLQAPEARERIVEGGLRLLEVAIGASDPGEVVERVGDRLGAGEAVKEEDRLLPEHPRPAVRPLVEQAHPEGHPVEERRVVVGGGVEQSERLEHARASGRVVAAIPRQRRRRVRRGGQQAVVSQAPRQRQRLGEERLGVGAMDVLGEHGVLVERRGGRALVPEQPIGADGVADVAQEAVRVAETQRQAGAREQRLDAQRRRARAPRPASSAASGCPRRSSLDPARTATAVSPAAAPPGDRGAVPRRDRRAGCRARPRAPAASAAGRQTAGRAPRRAPGTSRDDAARRCRARRPPRAARRRTGARCRADGSAHPPRRRATSRPAGRADRRPAAARSHRRRRPPRPPRA